MTHLPRDNTNGVVGSIVDAISPQNIFPSVYLVKMTNPTARNVTILTDVSIRT